jgi:hypothetical protein
MTDTWPMALTGLAVSCLVPALLLATRGRRLWHRLSVPPALSLPLFVLVHGAVTVGEAVWHPGPALRLGCQAALLATCVLYWIPVIGGPHRLSGAGRCLYLYLSAPCLDLPAVFLITLGHSLGGLAMIVAMLPVGLAAMATTWRWITEEERLAQAGAHTG